MEGQLKDMLATITERKNKTRIYCKVIKAIKLQSVKRIFLQTDLEKVKTYDVYIIPRNLASDILQYNINKHRLFSMSSKHIKYCLHRKNFKNILTHYCILDIRATLLIRRELKDQLQNASILNVL